jgi:nicotinate-nucleotide pyrophosphorylase (carboxylating)
MQQLHTFIDAAALDGIIRKALEEDIGPGDASALAVVPENARAFARIIAKRHGVIAGLEVCSRVYTFLDARVQVSTTIQDGTLVSPGDCIAAVSGSARSLLSGERTALNFLGHLSGIATKSRELNMLVAGSRLKLLDTRKTTPGLRMLEKYAVQAGGCTNHRRGLYDMIMLKENHLRAAESIQHAVQLCRSLYPSLKLEVECTSLTEVEQALQAGVDRIMFDNMDNNTIHDALRIVDEKCETEASGNMDAQRITELKDSGLDYISLGSLTHSVNAFDVSMLFD